MMKHYQDTMDATNKMKQALETDILKVRTFYKQQVQRHAYLLYKQQDLVKMNEGTSVQDCDMIHLNIGGTKMRVLRETLTLIKGSRLEMLFSGRWESRLLRDDDGCVFFDLDPIYFKKIVEYLYVVKVYQERKKFPFASDTKNKQPPKLPKLGTSSDQAVFDLYINFFRLQNPAKETLFTCAEAAADDEEISSATTLGCLNTSYSDLLETFNKEKEELTKVKEKLDEMEARLSAEERFVSFFITTDDNAVVEEGGNDNWSDTDDGISFASIDSDLDSNNKSSSFPHLSRNFNTDSSRKNPVIKTRRPIMNLSIEGCTIPVKLATLCSIKGSDLSKKFQSDSWMEKHTFQNDEGHDVVLMEYPLNTFKTIINQLRLLAIAESTSVESVPIIKKIYPACCSVLEDVVSTLFKEETSFNMKNSFGSSIIGGNHSWVKQIEAWLCEANQHHKSEPKLLYLGTRDGWSPSNFHSKCNHRGPTLTILKTNEGYIFGGFTDKAWAKSGGYKISKNAFLFSLHSYSSANTAIKMKIRRGYESYAVYNFKHYGPTFGSVGGKNDLRVGAGSTLCNGWKQGYEQVGHSYEVPPGQSFGQYFLTGSSDGSFTIEEIEVFQI